MPPSVTSPYVLNYDLTNCANEPINFIATVQAHAYILACKAEDWAIEQVSSNIAEVFDRPASAIVGQSLLALLPDDSFASLMMASMRGEAYMAANPLRINLQLNDQPRWFNCLLHPTDGLYIVELEPFDEDTVNYTMQLTISEDPAHPTVRGASNRAKCFGSGSEADYGLRSGDDLPVQ